MKLGKRIISFILAIVICISVSVSSVLAAWYNDLAYHYTQSNLLQWATHGIVTAATALGGVAVQGATLVIPGVGEIPWASIIAGSGTLINGGIDAFMDYLAADSSFVSEDDYVSSLDFPVIDNNMFGLPYDFAATGVEVVSQTSTDVELNNTSSSSRTGSISFYFSVSNSGQYTFHLPSFSCSCGSTHTTGAASVYLYPYSSDGTRLDYLWYRSGSSSDFPVVNDLSYSIGLSNTYTYEIQYQLRSVSFGYHHIAFAYTPYLTGASIVQNEPSTRPASLMQYINIYNNDNRYIDNSETVNYFIGSTNSGGEVTNIYAPNLFDEETMIFTEPVSGIQYQCTEWKYYYDQRAYVLKLADGSLEYDGQNVEYIGIMYGDDEVIVAGCSAEPTSDNLNLVFSDSYAYVTVTKKDSSTCQHSYTSEISTAATCTAPGVRTYTCSLCGNTYTEEIPQLDHVYTYETVTPPTCIDPGERKGVCSVCGAEVMEDLEPLGHDWQPTSSTQTTYALPEDAACPDCGSTLFNSVLSQSSGSYDCTCSSCGTEWIEQAVITYGQTTYTCTRCGETYVETQNADSGLFASIGNFIANGIGWVVDKLGQLVDSLSGLNDIFSDFIETIKENAGAYPAFLGAVIALLPEDLITVFWFGVIAFVVLAVWKKWFS